MCSCSSARYRINAYFQRGSVGAACRYLPPNVGDFAALGLPGIMADLAVRPRGLVLVAGPTGAGKTTTLASVVDYINRNRTVHIVTIEDPIEYVHEHKLSIVTQREVGADTHDFAHALRHVLRQDPDVVMIGEMRDLDTISAALTAAETGHLVFATLDGLGRVLACEVLIPTPAVRNLIRESKTQQLATVMQTGRKYGMVTMDESLADKYRQGLISSETALAQAHDPSVLRTMIDSVE